ncbi:MAG TPA: HAD-IA family hydrolase [Actinospica sp.]|nr:HAD-IA family hydrolase [Actinospica sp.]
MGRQTVAEAEVVGLDPGVRACLFDLDGVVTRTATIHAKAWKKTFDTFLRGFDVHSLRRDEPFDEHADYERYLDGRTRADGIRAFLGSRGIEVPDGDSDDLPGAETAHGIGAAQQWAFFSLLELCGPKVDQNSLRYVRAAREAGLACAVVSSAGDACAVLDAAGIADLFEATVDGKVATALGLLGKPAPDVFLAAAHGLEVEPADAAVFEGSLAGVDAARAGGFGTIVGVDRIGEGHSDLLRVHGATVLVENLSELLNPARRRPGLEG